MRGNFERQSTEHIEMLQAEMKVDNLGALILFTGAPVRYPTAS